MTAQTASITRERERSAKTAITNVVSLMNLKTIRPVQKSDIPYSRGKGRSPMHDLQVVKDFNALLDHVCERGLSPCEIGGEIDVTGPDVEAVAKQRKSFAQSFRKLLRQTVKDHGLHKQIDVREINSKFYVVGRSA